VQKSDVSPSGGQRRYLGVAQDLLTAIGRGDYEAGARLPAHGEVAARAGVSRATAREAFLALELIGAIEVRHGDGTFVKGRSPQIEGLQRTALDAPPQELIETRLHLEPLVAGLAAQRISEERVDQLADYLAQQQDLVDQPERVAAFVTLGLQFHADLAPGCGNSLLADIVEQLVDVERHPLWALINQRGLPDPASRQLQVDEHRSILTAIQSGDPDCASQAMRHHLDALEQITFALSGREEGREPA
jgi:DNA-binding FadR family transcriptional regulator